MFYKIHVAEQLTSLIFVPIRVTFFMKKALSLLLLLLKLPIFAQITGNITDGNQEPLSLVSIYLDQTPIGATSDENGFYELNIDQPGDYTIIFQYLGYKIVKKTVSFDHSPIQIDAILEEEDVSLDEIVVMSREHLANTIIRKAIANKEKNTTPFEKFTADFYSRGVFRVKNAPKKILGRSIGDLGGGLDTTRSGILYLSETSSKLSYQKKPKKTKELIIASKVSGSDSGISFNSAEEANFDFYSNRIVIAEGEVVSPISEGAFGDYKFRLEGSFYDKNGRLINKIKVVPKSEEAPAFRGHLYIVEDDWAIYGLDLVVDGKHVGIPIIDRLQFRQTYTYSETNNVWLKTLQTVDFKVGFLGFNVDGRFIASYSNYDLRPKFEKGTFSREILSYKDGATKKDSVFWREIRPLPLTHQESEDYKRKDRIKAKRNSKKYLDSIDQKNNALRVSSFLSGYTYKNSYEKWRISLNPASTMIAYNTVQGRNITANLDYLKRLNDKGNTNRIGIRMNYGFTEKKLRPVLYFNKKWNRLQEPRMTISGGITTRQFNDKNPISNLHNSIYTLFFKENYLKIYQKTFGKISYTQEITNGCYLSSSLEYAHRVPLFNTADNVIFERDIALLSNNPIDPTNFSAPFTSHRIASFNIDAKVVFGQKYASYPNTKFNMETPENLSFSVNYRKTFLSTNRGLHSDLLRTDMSQSISLGSVGTFKYAVLSGIFLQQKDIPFMDYIHVNGNQTDLMLLDRMDRFGLLNYYQFSTNDQYAEGHFEQHFKGLLLRKIPLVKRLNVHLITGIKTLFSAGRKPYIERSVGLDNLGIGKWRFFRITHVWSKVGARKGRGFLFGLTL